MMRDYSGVTGLVGGTREQKNSGSDVLYPNGGARTRNGRTRDSGC